ncbi:MAG: CpaD family pilus assembly protein [Alphaproteobacteria bacterium]|jgi:pilus assembly protein CpaD|nr:CpaD family pilus assembly protein [Alphaproteobacteria bacterium]MBU2040435.1 CpaD family pilus assembly protein [Alphaproteobacteria bacterium]MBU2124852.1 CpaD family pilus assembly protein [Alphaproteobacteria bacterium]MBU2209006.1 CpaD family pilus assembly protein [Alphaproteobacteria bacterium]MBU2291750.1 CpaD family pilus assembly protein [Alphaproteobacteria bacterium]
MRIPVKRALVSAILVLSAGLAASGCASVSGGDAHAPMTPLSRYVLQVEPGLDRIALAVHEQGLSSNQHAALRDLAARYGVSGADHVRIESPAGDDPAAVEQAYAMRNALQAAGVPGDRIQMAAYAAPDPRAPVLAGFETIRASIPDCAAEARNMGIRLSNQSSGGFGCAITANMAAQIADPRDILRPRAMTPADSGRAAVVFDTYRRGQPTATPQETLVEGRISGAVE